MSSSGEMVEEWRDLWSYKFDFVLVAGAFAFSALNLLNLPAYLHQYGGILFTIAYVTSLLVVCLPVILLELSVGQWVGRAPIHAFYSLCPLFKGVGVSQILLSLLVVSYLAVHVGTLFWFVFYLLRSVAEGPVPWLVCGQPWNSVRCENSAIALKRMPDPNEQNRVNSTAEFIHLRLFKRASGSIDEPGDLIWQPIASTGLVWAFVFLAILAGVRWLGKVFYFTHLIPLVLLVALMVRYLITLLFNHNTSVLLVLWRIFGWHDINWIQLLQFDIWKVALTQSMYATGIGFGAYITLGSYNKRTNNVVCDGFLIVLIHAFMTVLQVGTVLCLVSYLVASKGQPSDAVVDGVLNGMLKTVEQFITLLSTVSLLESEEKIWSFVVLFLLALLLLNFIFVLSLSVLSSCEDALGERASKCFPRLILALLICLLGTSLGLAHCTQAGKYTLELLHGSLDSLSLWVVLFFELLTVGWFYCGHRLGMNIRSMVNNCCCWIIGHFFMLLVYVLPLAPLFVALRKLWTYNFAEWYSAGIVQFEWSEHISWFLAVLPLLPIPLCAIYVLMRECCCAAIGATASERLKNAVAPKTTFELDKPSSAPRYPTTAPGYVLLPQQAPLAESENFGEFYSDRTIRISNL